MGSGESYKLWIIIQQPQNGFVQEKKKKKKIFLRPLFCFFCHGKHGAWPANLTDGLMQVAVDMGTASSISFPPSLIFHSKNPSCMENMRIILRLQAGTARRTPIEGAPLKKRLIVPGKRSTSLHPSQIHSVSDCQTNIQVRGGEGKRKKKKRKEKDKRGTSNSFSNVEQLRNSTLLVQRFCISGKQPISLSGTQEAGKKENNNNNNNNEIK